MFCMYWLGVGFETHKVTICVVAVWWQTNMFYIVLVWGRFCYMYIVFKYVVLTTANLSNYVTK